MDFEHKCAVVVNDENMQTEVDKIAAEGWTTFPNFPAVTVFHLFRPKGVQAKQPDQPMPSATPVFGINAELRIDDSKVFIQGPDGSIRKN